jgi:oxygen-dependent protoporphyrinogen oxidase
MTFATWVNGLTTLVERMLLNTQIEVRTSAAINSVRAMSDGRYELHATDGLVTEADAVVLAIPARIAADLIRPFSQNAAEMLRQVRYASVATAVVAYPRASITKIRALTGTGLLVPSSRRRLLKAATFLSTKWPHLTDPTYALLRFSSGRMGEHEIDNLGDAALVTRLHSDIEDATGIAVRPAEYLVQRWPSAIPQLEVGHLERVAKIRANLDSYPGLALAGASYDGLGIAACIRSGERAALSCLVVSN